MEKKDIIVIDNDKEYKATIIQKNTDGTYIVEIDKTSVKVRVYPEDIKQKGGV